MQVDSVTGTGFCLTLDTAVQPTLWGEVPNPGRYAYLYAGWRHGWIKIGWSTCPGDRKKDLRMKLLAMTAEARYTKRDEHRVHARLAPWHMAHEWYHPAPQVIAFVLALPVQFPWPPPILHMAA